jgi:MFS family permease
VLVRPRFTGLWRHREFRKLWLGTTSGILGLQVSMVALPMAAVLTLEAGPAETGFLRALETAPAILLGLLAGVWVDRQRRRPLLVAAELGRAMLLGTIPAAALLGLLRLEMLYVLAVLLGTLAILAEVAHPAFLTALVRREEFVEAHGSFAISAALAGALGPGLGGALVQAATAPVALGANALCFLAAALCFGLIRAREPEPTLSDNRRGIAAEVGEGLRAVWDNPLLRPIAAYMASYFLTTNMVLAVLVVYATRELGFQPALFGAILAASGPGALAGGIGVARLTQRLGAGPVLSGGALLCGLAALLIPLATGPQPVAAALLATAEFLVAIGTVLISVNQLSLRQAITAHHLQGRLNATFRSTNLGGAMLGALLGGALGETIGLRMTMLVGAVGLLAASLWLLLSPARTLRKLPPPVQEPASVLA